MFTVSQPVSQLLENIHIQKQDTLARALLVENIQKSRPPKMYQYIFPSYSYNSHKFQQNQLRPPKMYQYILCQKVGPPKMYQYILDQK